MLQKEVLQTGYAIIFQSAFILQALATVHKRTDSVAVPVSGIPTPPSSSYSFLSLLLLIPPSAAVPGPLRFTSTIIRKTGL